MRELDLVCDCKEDIQVVEDGCERRAAASTGSIWRPAQYDALFTSSLRRDPSWEDRSNQAISAFSPLHKLQVEK